MCQPIFQKIGLIIKFAPHSLDPFGNILAKSGPLADANTYRFSSQEYHQPSGLSLYVYRASDPNLQRWLNRDPILERGGLNLYAYVRNNPIVRVDAFGFSDVNTEKGLGRTLLGHYLFGEGENLSINSDAIRDEAAKYEETLLQRFKNGLCNGARIGESGVIHGYNDLATIQGSDGGLSKYLSQGHLKVTARWERRPCLVCFSDIKVEFQDEIIWKDYFRTFPAGWQRHFGDTLAYLATNGDFPLSALTEAGMFREYQVQIKWNDSQKPCFKCQN